MFKINEITAEPKQKHTLLLEDGTSFVMVLEYKPLQTGWFVTQLIYKDFEITNFRVVTSPNMLHQFKNQIPFGLGCFVQQDQEPTLKEDFTSKRAKMVVLTTDEVEYFGDYLSGQATP